ncbi:uncharacterized protein LOC124837603, partial [Vigna umbellata]|uniref:uncharacterized protein LOC124837603 n=1 Tax=Vigna umbellata TaxID=87088 RepID=UPI001F5FB017
MVEDEYVEPDEDEHQTVAHMTTLKKTRARDGSTLYFIYNAVDESGFEKIANAKSAKEAWEILEVAYKGDKRVRQVRIQALRGEFEQLKMEPKEHITEYITRVVKVVNQLNRNGEQIPSSQVVGKFLRSLTKDFESIVCAIEESKDLSVLTVDERAGAEVLEVEGEEAEDEVDMAEVILRMMKSKLVSRIGMTEDKGKAEEIGQEAGHIAKYCKTETKGEMNLVTEDAEEDVEELLLAKSKPVSRIGMTEDKGKTEEIGQELSVLSVTSTAGHIAKYCKTETKGETNLVTEDAEELLLAKSSDTLDMENSVSIVDEVIS